MIFILDTSVAIHLRDGDLAVRERLAALEGDVMLSILTRVELEGGVIRSDPDEGALRRSRVDTMLRIFPTLDFDAPAADKYGVIIRAVGYSRRKVIDRMIAAQALLRDATLVTMNGADFRDVPGLKLLAW